MHEAHLQNHGPQSDLNGSLPFEINSSPNGSHTPEPAQQPPDGITWMLNTLENKLSQLPVLTAVTP